MELPDRSFASSWWTKCSAASRARGDVDHMVHASGGGVAHRAEVALRDTELHAARHRRAEAGQRVPGSGECHDLEPDPTAVAHDREGLLALLGMGGQGSVGEAEAVRLVDDVDDATGGGGNREPDAHHQGEGGVGRDRLVGEDS